MRLVLAVFLFLFLAGDLAFGALIYQSYQKTLYLDKHSKFLQDLGRNREFVSMRDVDAWITPLVQSALQEKDAADPELRQLLRDWYSTDMSNYRAIFQNDPSSGEYLRELQTASDRFLELYDQIFSELATQSSKNSKISDEQSRALILQYQSLRSELDYALYNKKSGVSDRYLFPKEIVQEWLQNSEHLDNLLIYVLVYNTLLALAFAATLKWGPDSLLNDLNDSTSFFQKFLLLVWTPIAFELVFVAVLAGMFYHSNNELAEQQLWFSQDNNADKLARSIQNLLQGTFPSPREKYEIFRSLSVLKEKLKDHPQQVESLVQAEKSVNMIYELAPKLMQARANKDKVLEENILNLIVLNKTRAFLLAYYAKPEIGQQELVQGRQNSMKNQLVVARNLQIGLAISVVFNFILAFLLNSYFNRATSRRLEVITNNISLLSERKPLLPALQGGDEFAGLDRTFHRMSGLLLETIKRERAAIDNASDFICSLDSSLKVSVVNPVCVELWGGSEDALLGKRLPDLLSESSRGTSIESVLSARSKHESVKFEGQIEPENGEIKDLLWSVQWSDTEQQYFCVAQDITEKKQIERLKQEFVAMVSHDLRTPLTASTMFLELLEIGVYGDVSEDGQKHLSNCTKQVHQLIALIKDLLDIERLESGKIEFEFSAVDVEDIIDTALDTLRNYIKRKNLVLKKDYEEDSLIGDEDRLIQALIAQLANAIKLAASGSELQIKARKIGENIRIETTFVAEERLHNFDKDVFEKYQKQALTDPSDCGGTRLGLALSLAIVQRHGGLVDAFSLDSEKKQYKFVMQVPVMRVSESSSRLDLEGVA